MAKRRKNPKLRQYVLLREQRGRDLYLAFYKNGKRQYEWLGKEYKLVGDKDLDTYTREKAEKVRLQREQEIRALQYAELPDVRMNADFIQYFANITATQTKSKKPYINTLKHLQKHTNNKKIRFRDVNELFLENFQTYLLNVVSSNSAHNYYYKVKAVLNKALRDKIISKNPADLVRNIRFSTTQREYLTLDEVKLLQATPCRSDEVKQAFIFCCFTGLRISDVKKLTWKEIDLNTKTLVFQQEKTGSTEHLPLPTEAISILKRRKEDSPLVFHLLKDEHTRISIKQWAKAAGIEKNISFHSARHTFATMALTYGVDLYTTSKLLGHATIKHTQIYAKVIDQSKRDAVNKFPTLK